MHISATLSDKTELGIDLGDSSTIDDVMAILNWITPTSKGSTPAVIDIKLPGDAELEQLRNELLIMTNLRDHWKGRAETAERHLMEGAPKPLPAFEGKSVPMGQPAASQPCQEAARPAHEAGGELATAKAPETDEMLVHSTVFTGRSLAWKEGFRACRDYRLDCDAADRGNAAYPAQQVNPYNGVKGAKAWDDGYEEAGRYAIDKIPDPDA